MINLIKSAVRGLAIFQDVAIVLVVSVAVIALVALAKWASHVGMPDLPTATPVSIPNPLTAETPLAELDRLVQQTYRTRSIVTTPSGNLLDEINRNPKEILVGLVVAERGWPYLTKTEKMDLVSEARVNSSEALEHLRAALRRRANLAISEAGHNPAKENWDNNNPSTAILFCYWPKAEQKGKESQFLREFISGQRDKWTSWVFEQ